MTTTDSNRKPHSTLGVALIGAGGIGEIRAESVIKTNGLKLQVVADLRLNAAKAVAEKSGCRATADWKDAVRDPLVHLIVVSTPPNTHGAISLAAIAEKKHVLVEKPLAHTLEDAEKMCEAARAQGVVLKTGFNHRYFQSMAAARNLIDSGRIGEVISVHAFAGHPGGKEFGHDWVHEGSVTGGGSLVDNGIHIIDLVRFFLGDVQTAKGYVANLIWPFENAEDNSFALFRTSTGRIAHVHATWTEWRGYRFAIEAVCTRGYAKASYPPMLLEWGETPAPGIRAKRHRDLFPVFQVRERLQGWRWTIVESFVKELTDVARDIQNGTQTSASGADGLRAMQMAHAIYRSSREGKEMTV